MEEVELFTAYIFKLFHSLKYSGICILAHIKHPKAHNLEKNIANQFFTSLDVKQRKGFFVANCLQTWFKKSPCGLILENQTRVTNDPMWIRSPLHVWIHHAVPHIPSKRMTFS